MATLAARFERVAIVGVGLIGGSLAIDCRANGKWGRIVGIGRSQANLDIALERGLIDEASREPHAVAGCDLVIMATPVASLVSMARRLAPHLPPGCLVIDVGSVKGTLSEEIQAVLPAGVHFVGTHPIAGSEQAGAAAARAGLFVDAHCIVVPAAGADSAVVARVEALWQSVGARVIFMDGADHDGLFAAVSHLPHVVAYALAATVLAHDGERRRGFAGAGFRDTTRIARSSPEMWRDICLLNRDAVLQEIDRFRATLEELRAALAAGDGDALLAAFTAARDAIEGGHE
ncbi:MAG: prephenate dehydrogenase/arogenate dehydrogenase family protein [Nitrospirota bacterium]|jgi:prephenate dehydrogenase